MTESNEGPKCDKCGVECTTGMMAAFCSKGRECEFWPHSNGDLTLAGGELLMYRFWMDNTLEQIGLQIDERKRLERELAEARAANASLVRWKGEIDSHLIAARVDFPEDYDNSPKWAIAELLRHGLSEGSSKLEAAQKDADHWRRMCGKARERVDDAEHALLAEAGVGVTADDILIVKAANAELAQRVHELEPYAGETRKLLRDIHHYLTVDSTCLSNSDFIERIDALAKRENEINHCTNPVGENDVEAAKTEQGMPRGPSGAVVPGRVPGDPATVVTGRRDGHSNPVLAVGTGNGSEAAFSAWLKESFREHYPTIYIAAMWRAWCAGEKRSLSQDSADAKDAARYRFLRVDDNWGEDAGPDFHGSAWGVLGEKSGREFDEFIDARMREGT